jgi:hypothetical protein
MERPRFGRLDRQVDVVGGYFLAPPTGRMQLTVQLTTWLMRAQHDCPQLMRTSLGGATANSAGPAFERPRCFQQVNVTRLV